MTDEQPWLRWLTGTADHWHVEIDELLRRPNVGGRLLTACGLSFALDATLERAADPPLASRCPACQAANAKIVGRMGGFVRGARLAYRQALEAASA